MSGTVANPIDIDQEEEPINIEAIKEQNRNKQIIEEAKLIKQPLYLCLAVIKTTIKGDIKTKNMTLNRAIIQYFQEKVGINISHQHFHPRPEPNYSETNTANPKQFIVYGVDFLTTSKIKDRFHVFQTNIDEIFWINSSTCKIKYKTAEEAKKVLESLVADPKQLTVKINENEDVLPQGWFTMNNYLIYYFERQLLIRYATEDQTDIIKQSTQKFNQFELAQDELLQHLFQKFNAHEAYEKIARQIERERNINQIRNFRNQQRNRRNHRSRTRDNCRNHRSPINTSFELREQRVERSYQPESVRLREVRREHYEHQPVTMRNRMRDQRHHTQSRHRQMRPPMKGNVYYDCNDIEDQQNLSFNSIEDSHHDSDNDDLEENLNLTIPFKSKTNNISQEISSQDLSMAFISSKTDKNNESKGQIPETSFLMAEGLNHTLEADTSIAKIDKKDYSADHEDIESSLLFPINEEISPIQQNTSVLDTSIPIICPAQQSRPAQKDKKSNKKEYLDYKKPEKKKPHKVEISIQEDEEGY